MHQDESGTRDLRWWLGEDEFRASACVAAAQETHEVTLDRQQQILNNYAMYGERQDHLTHHDLDVDGRYTRRITENVIATAMDSWLAQITQSKPRTMFTTVSGSWDEQGSAKKLTAYCDVKRLEVEAREKLASALLAGGIAGLGCVRPFVDRHSRRVDVDLLHPLQVLIDDVSMSDIPPRAMHIRVPYDRAHLAALYPEHEEAIAGAAPPDPTMRVLSDARIDSVMVYEAWHLPSVPLHPWHDRAKWERETDGLHMICFEDTILFEEPYGRASFPLVFIRPLRPTRGFWGHSFVERAAPLQKELNKLSQRRQEGDHLVSVPRVWMRAGDFQKRKMVAGVGNIIETKSGQPPTFMAPPAAHPSQDQRRAELRANIFQVMGISETFSGSQKPVGLSSGRAQLVYNDTRTRRHIESARAYEGGQVSLDREIVVCERDLATYLKDEHDVNHEVIYKSRSILVTIPWAELDLEDSKVRIQAFPTSSLPTEPAARFQMLEQMLQGGHIDNQMFWQMAELPDPEGTLSLQNAPYEWIMWRMDEILSRPGAASFAASTPTPYMDVELAIKLCTLKLQMAEMGGASQSSLHWLRRWFGALGAESKSRQDALAPPPAPPPMPPGAGMGGAPPMPPGPMGPPGAPGAPGMLS